MKLIKQVDAEAMQVYEAFWTHLLHADTNELSKLFDKDFRQFGTTEAEAFFGKEQAIDFVDKTATQIINNIQIKNRLIKTEPVDGLIVVIEQSDVYVRSEGNWVFYSKCRASTLLQKKDSGWKLIQQHISLPDGKTQEGETIALEKISKENLELREAVKRRTLELEQKNRELQIEASLERIRSRTLEMKDSDELADAASILFNQFKQLSFLPENARTYFTIIDKRNQGGIVWLTKADGTVRPGSHSVPFTTHKPLLQLYEAIEQRKPIHIRDFTGDILNDYLQFLSTLPHVQNDEALQQLIKNPPGRMVFTDAIHLYGTVGIMAFEPISEEAQKTLIRFAKVFEFTYTRFLDLQTAEAQAREATIEMSLERVRSKTMAMHNSQDLLDVISLLSEQFQLLGFKVHSANFNTSYREKDWNLWANNPGTPMYADQIHIPYFDHPYFNRTIESLANGADFNSFVFSKAEKDRFLDYIYTNTLARQASEQRKKYTYEAPGFAWSVVYLKNTAVMIANYDAEPYTEEQNAILRRFGNVFEQTYTRFLDLQNAEAQAREAKIEAALERVRSRAMAMHKTDELLDAGELVYKELTGLGITSMAVSYAFVNEEDKNALYYGINPVDGKVPPVPFVFPHTETEEMRSVLKSWKKQEAFKMIELDEEATLKHQNWVARHIQATFAKNKIPFSVEAFLAVSPQTAVIYTFHFTQGYIFIIGEERLSAMQEEMVLRFTKVFEMTYRRFLDLQKAEAQAREGQIELGLERVRAKAMGMQHSDHLKAVIEVIGNQLHELGLYFDFVNFIVGDTTNGFDTWNVSFGQANPVRFFVPYIQHRVFNETMQARKDGLEFNAYTMTEEETFNFVTHLITTGILRYLPEEALQKRLHSKGMSVSTAVLNEVFLTMANYSAIPYTYEDSSLLKRFGTAFQQAYTRFLDLQKAEAQAREAQIEAALERVRSSSLAMHHSEELQTVVNTVIEQLVILNIQLDTTNILLYNRKERAVYVWTGSNSTGKQLTASWKVPYADVPWIKELIHAWESGQEFFTDHYFGEIKDRIFDYLFADTDFKNLVPERKKFILESPAFTPATAMVKDVAIQMMSYSRENFAQDEIDILKRFTKVFYQTYTRFLDLQKAEAQAREAKIEASLERVRSKAMAMHNSQDLADTIGVFYKELHSYSMTPRRCGVGLLNKENKTCETFTWNTTAQGESLELVGKIKMVGHLVLEGIYNNWVLQKEYHPVLRGNEIKEYYQLIRPQIGFPDYPNDVIQYGYFFFFNEGGVYAWTENEMKEDELKIYRRFTSVLSLTYKRYNDLQKAEAQAREAEIELAMERVRARTMAMQKSDELPEAANLLFQQVQALGMPAWSAGYCIWDDDKKAITLWMSSEGVLQPPFKAPLTEDPSFIHMREAHERGESFFVREIGGEELVEHYKYMRTLPVVGEILDSIFEAGHPLPTFQIFHLAYFSQGFLLFITYEPVPDAHDIFKRFGKVFDQTYTRFLDLQKAEAQARESRIEAVLERVRSRTMAMQKSDELTDVAGLLFEQVSALGIKTWTAGFNVWSEDNNSYVDYITSPQGGFIEPYTVLTETAEALRDISNARKSGVEFDVQYVEGEKIKQLYLALTKLDEKQYEIMLQDGVRFPSHQYEHFVFGSKVSLMFITYEPVPEAHDIFKRLGKVFEQTYTRFLDLQKAEAQAREAQIETALERVRSRSMGMQKSEELKEVIKIVYQQLTHLKINLDHSGFVVDYTPGGDWHFWIADEQDIPSKITHPYFESVWANQFNAAKEKGADFFATNLNFEEKNRFYNELLSYVPGLPEASKDFYLSCPGLAASTVLFDNVSLYIENFSGIPYSDEENKILMRFGKVFQQTYTRFLDLQKAEAQAREATIEASMERVRAKTMAMHSSDDVSTAIATMFTELEKLGIENLRCGIANIRSNQTMEVWSVSNVAGGKTVKGAGTLDMNVHPLWRLLYQGWEKKEDFLYYYLADKEKEDYVNILNTTPSYLTEAIRQFPDMSFQAYFFNEGGIWTFSLQPHSEENKQVMKRFTSVFALTFRRYQDLKKAEAQAREATIEAGLERVRGKAMAMHNSNDLIATASMVFTELRKLGINPVRCGVSLQTKESRKNLLYYAIPSAEGDNLSFAGTALLAGHPVLSEVYDSWIRGEDYFPVLKGDLLTNYYQTLKQVGFDVPASPKGHEQYGYYLPFSEGMFYGWAEKPFTETELKVLKRFATVIDLTFRRYMELQKSEANAREAVKQAALDRIRAEIASMRTINDLDRITPLIWNELTILGVAFIRCGVFIMDDANELIHTFLSTPEGKAIAAFHIPYTTPGNIEKVLSHWQHKKNYIDHWDESAFTEFAGTLVKEGALLSPEEYLETIPRGGFYLHFLPFLQGMLYVGNTTQLDEEEIKLIQSVADAFSTAYARYEDFNRLEAAKQQVDKTLVDLKQAQTQLVQSEKMASLGELTAGIAHEIQNPLNFVNNFSEVNKELIGEMKQELQAGNNEEAIAIANDLEKNLEKINHHGKRADSIVKGMMQHSQASTGQKELTDINALADEYLRLSFHGIRAKDKSFNANFETDFDSSLDKINTTPQDIGRVLLNLYNNAFYAINEKRKAADENYQPNVSVQTKKINDKIEIRVSDNGNGIPQNIVDKIFQPFFTTKPTGQGTGLGLSLSYDIIKAHGGEINIETTEGEGTKFIIKLLAV